MKIFKNIFFLGLFFAILTIFGFPAYASATTYYVRADGLATKINAVGPTSDTTKCMSMTTFNASTFSTGDTIYFSALGGNYSTGMIIPSSGNSSSSLIIYEGLDDGTGQNYPTISLIGTPLTISAKSNITIKNFILFNLSSAAYQSVVRLGGAVTNNYINFFNLTLSAPNSASGYGLNASATCKNILVNNLNISSTTDQSIYFYGANSSDITIQNTSINSTGGMRLRYVTNLNIFENTITASGSTAIYIQNSNGSILQHDNVITQKGSLLPAVYYDSSTLNGNVYDESVISAVSGGFEIVSLVGPVNFSNIIVDHAYGPGFRIKGNSSNLNFLKCIAQNGSNDGFITNDTAHDITFEKCRSSNNGNKNTTSEGDGFTSHLTNYNINIKYCVIDRNTASAYAMVNSSSGHIYNNTSYLNANNWSLEGGSKLNQVRGSLFFSLGGDNPISGTGWEVKNSISSQNYPREILLVSPTNPHVVSDYNLYNPLNDLAFGSINDGLSEVSWSSYSTRENNSFKSDPEFISDSNFNLLSTSPAIDSGDASVVNSTTTDYLDNPIYGIPDIGAYEYQPPYSIMSDDVEYSGNIRIYGDGKYRYTTATTTDFIADFLVTPASGSYFSYDSSKTRPEYINISNINWGENKEWTASSSFATTTIYTIGDLIPNSYYAITLDGEATTTITSEAKCHNNYCLSDHTGHISFTYSGGYSTHVFSLIPDNDSPTDLSLISPENNDFVESNSLNISWSNAFDSSGIKKYQFYLNNNLYEDDIVSSTTSLNINQNITCGPNIWQIKAFDNNDNSTLSNSWMFNVACGGNLPVEFFLAPKRPNITIDNPEGLFLAKISSYDINTKNVVLKFVVGLDTEKMAISEDPNFTNSIQEKFVSPYSFVLSTSSIKYIYVKFFNQYGRSSEIVKVTLPSVTNDKKDNDLIKSQESVLNLKPIITRHIFLQDLKIGMNNSDVKELQKYLNNEGFFVSSSGPGSIGEETNFFGNYTKNALIKFQEFNKIYPAIGYFGPITRKLVNLK